MTSIVKTSCSGCRICTLPCLYYRSRQSVAAHASSSRRGTLLKRKKRMEAFQEFHRVWQAWGFWVMIAGTIYCIGAKARLTPVPKYFRLPTLLTLPVVEASKTAVAFYTQSGLHSKARIRQFYRRYGSFSHLAIVIVMLLCIYYASARVKSETSACCDGFTYSCMLN